ncbi:MAG: hypothetical protein OEV28_11800, partial [Nitrospirota bacterium]|nr:hypothetical protein [Nitrospirota bacterium]
FTPYVRYEYLNVDDDDPYFRALDMQNDRKQAIVGLRYDIDTLKSSIKLQYRYDKQKHERTYNVIETQWAFSF